MCTDVIVVIGLDVTKYSNVLGNESKNSVRYMASMFLFKKVSILAEIEGIQFRNLLLCLRSSARGSVSPRAINILLRLVRFIIYVYIGAGCFHPTPMG